MDWNTILVSSVVATIISFVGSIISYRLQRQTQFQSKLQDLQFEAYRQYSSRMLEAQRARFEILDEAISDARAGNIAMTYEEFTNRTLAAGNIVVPFTEFEADLLTPLVLRDALVDFWRAQHVAESTIFDLLANNHVDLAERHLMEHCRKPYLQFCDVFRHVLGIEQFSVVKSGRRKQLSQRFLDTILRRAPASSTDAQRLFAAMAKLDSKSSSVNVSSDDDVKHH